jgi:hypothetical protein
MRRTPDRAEAARWNRQTKPQPNGCIIFIGPSSADGYARWKPRPGANTVYAHVYSYELAVGEIPEGMQVDHKCHTEDTACPGGQDCPHRRCVNPAHLELVTPSENTLRQRHANRLKSVCPKGHELAGDNVVVWSDGKRRCRTCLKSRKA